MRKLVGIKKVEKFPLYDITVDKDHCFELVNGVIAHNSMFPTTITSGGTGQLYSSDTIFIVGRQQEKDGKDLAGYNFIINVEKSRYVKEKSKIPITVKFEGGLSKYTGLLEIALESGFVQKPKNGWYCKVDMETGELGDKNYRAKDTDTAEFWDSILNDQKFKDWVEKRYQVSHGKLMDDDSHEIDEPEDVYDDLDID